MSLWDWGLGGGGIFIKFPEVMTRTWLRTIRLGQHFHGYFVHSQKLFFTAQELLDYINLTRNSEIIDKSEASSTPAFYLFPLLLPPTEMMVLLRVFIILQSQRKSRAFGCDLPNFNGTMFYMYFCNLPLHSTMSRGELHMCTFGAASSFSPAA